MLLPNWNDFNSGKSAPFVCAVLRLHSLIHRFFGGNIDWTVSDTFKALAHLLIDWFCGLHESEINWWSTILPKVFIPAILVVETSKDIENFGICSSLLPKNTLASFTKFLIFFNSRKDLTCDPSFRHETIPAAFSQTDFFWFRARMLDSVSWSL